jgi:hypothetical protein
MSLGKKIASRSKLLSVNAPEKKKPTLKNTHPVMIYLETDLNVKWEEYAHKKRTSKSQIAREAIQSRVSGDGDPYTNGYNAALEEVAEKIRSVEAFQMTFPSGKSFAEFAEETIATLYRDQENG